MKRALIPGSFDPITVGHFDVIKRCSALFDEVHVVIFGNTEKGGKGMFDRDECFNMLKLSVEELGNVRAAVSSSLVVDYASENSIDVIVKGVRDTVDFEYEHGLYVINKDIGNIDTLFVPASPEYKHVSSTFVRDMIKYGRDYSAYVPQGAYEYIKELVDKKK